MILGGGGGHVGFFNDDGTKCGHPKDNVLHIR